MTEQDQKQLGATLWAIANNLRGAMKRLPHCKTGIKIQRILGILK